MAKSDDHKHKNDKAQTRSESPAEVQEEPTSQHSARDEEASELLADLQRVQAEFVNYRRRAEAEKADIMSFATSRIVREFLTVRDSFDNELAHRPVDINPEWAAAIDAIRAQFDKVMAGLRVERFESVGHEFDPHRHEAVAMEDGEGAHEVVVEELQAGYQLEGTVLRHAVVKVGKSDQVKTKIA
jgi:molecular chaperone GrpE